MYLPRFLAQAGDLPFRAQCIPTRDELLAVEQDKRFLAERRQQSAACLNTFLGTDQAESAHA